MKIFNSDGFQTENVQVPFPSQNILFEGDSVFVGWGLACLRVSLSRPALDPKLRLKSLLNGVEEKSPQARVFSAPKRFFVNFKKILWAQGGGGSLKSLDEAVLDLSKKADPFKRLSELLSRSLEEIKRGKTR